MDTSLGNGNCQKKIGLYIKKRELPPLYVIKVMKFNWWNLSFFRTFAKPNLNSFYLILLSSAMAGKTGLKAKWRHLADLPHSGARHPHHGTPLPYAPSNFQLRREGARGCTFGITPSTPAMGAALSRKKRLERNPVELKPLEENQRTICSGTHRQNAPMTVIVTSPCLLQLQCIHRPTLPICRYVTCHEVILADVQPCPR